MRIFTKFNLILAFVVISSINLYSGATNYKVTIGNIDATKFDTVRTSFAVYNLNNQTISDIPLSTLKVSEDGNDVTPSLKINCHPVDVIPPLNITLCLDLSGSMDKDGSDPTSIRRYDWVVKACSLFFQTIKWVPGTQVSVLGFSGQSRILSLWDTNQKALMDSITHAYLGGATDYNPPMFNPIPDGRKSTVPYLWSLLTSEQQQNRKIVVFLTDGQPSPGRDTKVLTIQDSVGKFAQIYTLTLLTPMNDDLRKVAGNSNAFATECNTEEDLLNAFTLIASDAQKQTFCTLSWQSPYGCDASSVNRTVKITFQMDAGEEPIVTNRSYIAPDKSIMKYNLIDKIVGFGNPDVGDSNDKTIRFQILNAPTLITSIIDQPSKGYFKILGMRYSRWGLKRVSVNDTTFRDSTFVIDTNKTFTLPFLALPGDSIFIDVRFYQLVNIDFREARLVVTGTPCPVQIPIYGGVSNVLLRGPDPTTLNVFSTCQNIDLAWAGVDSITPVYIYYSYNNGPWNLIPNSPFKGGITTWNPVNGAGNYKFKLEVKATIDYRWAKSYTSDVNSAKFDIARSKSICFSPDSLFLYVAGNFNDSLIIKGKKYASNKTTSLDMFLMKINTDGDIQWVETAGGPGTDTVTAVACDPNGNVYITGTCQYGAKFGGSPISGVDNLTANYFFVAKYPPIGGIPAVFNFGAGTTSNSDINCGGVNLMWDKTKNAMTVNGGYNGKYYQKYFHSNLFVLKANNFNFSIDLDANVTVPFSEIDFNTFVPMVCPPFDCDSVNFWNKGTTIENTYFVGSFKNTKILGPFTLTAKGANDFYIAKKGKNKASVDTSLFNNVVEVPQITYLKSKTINCGTVNYQIPNDTSFSSYFKNSSKLPITINSYIIAGVDSASFKLQAPKLINYVMQPNQTDGIQLSFTPFHIGLHTANLIINIACNGKPDTIALFGNGICTSLANDTINMGSTYLKVPMQSTFTKVFTNTNGGQISIQPELSDPQYSIPDSGITYRDPNTNTDKFFNYGAKIPVPALTTVDVKINFNPTKAGNQECILDFKVTPQPGCLNSKTIINALGINSNVKLFPYDFKGKRIHTVNDYKMWVINDADAPTQLGSIVTTNNKDFNLTSKLTFPLDLKAHDSIPLDFQFKPLDEIDYVDSVTVNIVGSIFPVTTYLKGTGENPKLNIEWVCPNNKVKVNQKGFVTMNLTNSSKTDTKVTLNLNPNDATYTFDNSVNTSFGQFTTNEFIVPSGGVNFPISLIFSPVSDPAFDAQFHILADTSTGNDKDASFIQPFVYDTTFNCEVISPLRKFSVPFGNVLGCGDTTISIKIKNTFANPMTVYFDSLTFVDKSKVFTHSIKSDIVIPVGDSSTFNVSFTSGTKDTTYKGVLTLKLSTGSAFEYDLSATVTHIELQPSPLQNIKSDLGKQQQLYINAKLPVIGSGISYIYTHLGFSIRFNPEVVAFNAHGDKYDSVKSLIKPNFFKRPYLKNDSTLIVEGDGAIFVKNPSTFEDMFSINYTTLLGKTNKYIINAFTNDDCGNISTKLTEISLDGVCDMTHRLVGISGTLYKFDNPAPNIINHNTTLDFSLGIEAPTRLEVLNTMGEVVLVLINETLEVGEYTKYFNIENLSSGLYFIRLNSGPFSDTKKIMIQK